MCLASEILCNTLSCIAVDVINNLSVNNDVDSCLDFSSL